MRRFSIFAFALAALATLSADLDAARAETVKVGGYVFEPFVMGDGEVGLTPRILDHWNSVQDDYTFEFVPTSPQRRYQYMEEQRYDIMLFESAAWGWDLDDMPVSASKVFMEGGEVFVARARDAGSADYFTTLDDKRIGAMSGYHYSFADFNADRDYLNETFDITLSDRQSTNLRLVEHGRLDLAVVTEAFYEMYVAENPGAAEALAKAEERDQDYRHTVLVGDHSPIAVAEIDALMTDLTTDGTLDRLLAEMGQTLAQ